MTEWTTIVLRNGVKLDLPLDANGMIEQLISAGKSGGLSLVRIALRDGAVAVLSAPDVVAIAAQAMAGQENLSTMLQPHVVVSDGADRVTEIKRDAGGKITSSVSRAVRARDKPR